MTLIFKNFDWSRCTERDSAKHLLHLLMPRSTLHIKDLQTRNSHVRRYSRNVIGRGHLVAVTGVSVELTRRSKHVCVCVCVCECLLSGHMCVCE